MGSLARLWEWFTGESVFRAEVNARMAAMDRAAERVAHELDSEELRCAKCLKPLQFYSYENDYHCAAHGFVNAVRARDGAVIAGTGQAGCLVVIGHVHVPPHEDDAA